MLTSRSLTSTAGVDFISGFIFGSATGTDFLDDEVSREKYFEEWNMLRRSPQCKEKPVTEDLFMRKCKVALASPPAKGTRPLVIERMHAELSFKNREIGVSDNELLVQCASEMLDHVIATQETQTITWTYILYRLSLQPQLQDELRSELKTLQPAFGSNVSEQSLPNSSEIDKLPLLNAIVYETLRLHAANPARMRRVVPSSGVTLHEHFIPPGTVVSTNAYCLHRNPKIFPEPFDWKPERWLPAAEGLEAKHKWFWAFGSGPRGCIGRHFALQGKKLLVSLTNGDAFADINRP